jgi:hypothetical protein
MSVLIKFSTSIHSHLFIILPTLIGLDVFLMSTFGSAADSNLNRFDDSKQSLIIFKQSNLNHRNKLISMVKNVYEEVRLFKDPFNLL